MHVLHKLLLFHVVTGFRQNALGSEIINGAKSKRKSMLYMASVQNNRNHICGGFLVSEDFVMTAAHCDDYNPTSVVLGTHNLKMVNDDMRYDVKRCKHSSYVNVSEGNDIMLLKLSRRVHLSKKNLIKPIQLPTQQIKLKKNEKCQVAGWGYIRTNGSIVAELRVVDVPIINLKECNKEWHNILPEGVICAGGFGTNKGFCQGDSGGPLVCNRKLAVGVVSFNNNENCNYPDLPNVFTDISKLLPWIKDILKKKQCEVYKQLYKRANLTPPKRQVHCLAAIMRGLHKFLLFQVLACLGQSAHGSKIIHGHKVPENSMQFMVSVQNFDGHVCGGFLVSEDFVMTAAHCEDSNPFLVVFGTHNLNDPDREIRFIERHYKPETYHSVANGGDIMLLKLSEKAEMGNGVQLIELPTSEIQLPDNALCQVAGWGLTETSGFFGVDDLRVVDVSVINPNTCKELWYHLPDGVICAGGYGTNKGFCQGDSGGPLVCNGMAVGVVSYNWNRNCNYPNAPNVYTDVSKYLPWIKNILNHTKI
ncbi:transmembrane protease serine 9-like [Trachinotus anak]|uniref:transmembrane protease serine 9-like n=1 Tax=Trachinotus anak TaxID=443729 RepID=UPI0039F21CED